MRTPIEWLNSKLENKERIGYLRRHSSLHLYWLCMKLCSTFHFGLLHKLGKHQCEKRSVFSFRSSLIFCPNISYRNATVSVQIKIVKHPKWWLKWLTSSHSVSHVFFLFHSSFLRQEFHLKLSLLLTILFVDSPMALVSSHNIIENSNLWQVYWKARQPYLIRGNVRHVRLSVGTKLFKARHLHPPVAEAWQLSLSYLYG